MAHTPGPWKAYRHDLHADEVTSPDGDSIAEVYSTGDPADFHANTNLIAAAPDLLDAAKDAAQALSAWPRHTAQHLFNIREALRAAIAKAEDLPVPDGEIVDVTIFCWADNSEPCTCSDSSLCPRRAPEGTGAVYPGMVQP